VADELPERLSHLGEDAGKLADLVPGVPEPGEKFLPPARSEQLARAELCTPGAVPYAGRSCAATAPAAAVAQWASLVSLPQVSPAVAALASAESRAEPELRSGPWAVAQSADVQWAWSAQLVELSRRSSAAVPMAAREL
jgi:hypothetical protein